jgi:ribose 5-phosphate isomerase A
VSDVESFKRAAAERAVDWVRSGMVVGLGTGSTAVWAVRRIGALLGTGELRDVSGVPTAVTTAEEAVAAGVPLLDDGGPWRIDVTIDGADEVDPALDLVKGGGGALLREKVVAQASDHLIIVVDDSKPSPRLGAKHALPVEVVPFGWGTTQRWLAGLGAVCTLRVDADGAPWQTDQGNYVVDCDFGPIDDVPALAGVLADHAGVAAHGLFVGLARTVVVAGPSGVDIRQR